MLGAIMGTEVMTSRLLRGEDSGDDIIPFSQTDLRRNESFFNSDPAFNSAFQALASFIYGANVIASRVKGLAIDTPLDNADEEESESESDSESEQGVSASESDTDSDSSDSDTPSPSPTRPTKAKATRKTKTMPTPTPGAPQLATAEFQLFVSRVFPKLIVPAVRALWVDGFVGYTIEKVGNFRVPVLLHPRMYVPALRLQQNRRVDLVGVMSDMKNVDKSIHIFTRETHTHTGAVISLASLLYPGWRQQQALVRAAVHMDQIASQNMQIVESVPAIKPTDPEVSLYADADRFEADAETSFYSTETGMQQFAAHNERVDEQLRDKFNVVAPTLKPIPPNYRLARGVYPTTRTNVADTESTREDVVFAACGVPKSLVMATNKMSADTAGAYRTFNATLGRMRLIIGDLFREMYLHIYPDDSDIHLEVEIEGLMSGEAIETAGLNGFLSEKDFGAVYLKNANIPQSKLYKGLSNKPAKPESRELQPSLSSLVQGSAAQVKAKRKATEQKGTGSTTKKPKTANAKSDKKKKETKQKTKLETDKRKAETKPKEKEDKKTTSVSSKQKELSSSNSQSKSGAK